ncbi:MAG TPA: acyltransferase [Methylococcaceae bacterium]|nr:acyltransferase [Methylococcaceae bacterium]
MAGEAQSIQNRRSIGGKPGVRFQGTARGREKALVSLDILRMVAALLVVSYHYFFYSWAMQSSHEPYNIMVRSGISFPEVLSLSWWGWVGVEIFFVISGYVIASTADNGDAASFARSRLLRLTPAIFFFSTAAYLIVVAMGSITIQEASLLWLKSLILFPKGPWIDGVLWTLTVEVLFYSIIGVTLHFRGRNGIPRLARVGAAVVMVFWLAASIQDRFVALGHFGEILMLAKKAYFAKYFLITTGSFFLVGMISREIGNQGATPARLAWLFVMVVCSCLSILTTADQTSAVLVLSQSRYVPMFVWLSVVLILGLAIALEPRFQIGDAVRAHCRQIGLLTYPIYLVHFTTGGWIFAGLVKSGVGKWEGALATICVCFVVSYGFNALVEPGLKGLISDWLGRRRQGLPVT